MPPLMLQELLGGLIAASGGLTALFMILRYKLKTREAMSPEKLERLFETQDLILQSLEDIREEIGTHQGEMRELSGRVEFAERLLARARDIPGD